MIDRELIFNAQSVSLGDDSLINKYLNKQMKQRQNNVVSVS